MLVKVSKLLGAAFAAVLLFVVAAIPAGAMTVTFVRHGESEGNASGLIDTKVPGPPLTALGALQAAAVATALGTTDDADKPYDGVYASTMIRTQQTAAPFAALVGKNTVVVDGMQEINAGVFEGSSEDSGLGRIGYIAAPLAWTLGLRFVRIPGSEDGNEFDARVDGAIADMAADGAENPVAFSHGATIMFWTMMNVDNPDLLLIATHQLDNTDVVVVESNGDGGWTLKSWAGEEVAPATLPTKLFVNTRDLVVAPQTAVYNLSHGETVAQGAKDVGDAAVRFVTKSAKDIGDAVEGLVPAASTSEARKANGATDLTAGNKVTPGRDGAVATALSKNAERVRRGLQDVGDDISESIRKAGEAIKKVADSSKKPAGDTDTKPAAQDAA